MKQSLSNCVKFMKVYKPEPKFIKVYKREQNFINIYERQPKFVKVNKPEQHTYRADPFLTHARLAIFGVPGLGFGVPGLGSLRFGVVFGPFLGSPPHRAKSRRFLYKICIGRTIF